MTTAINANTTPRFGAHIRKLRKRLGITQAEAAVLLDVSIDWVGKCERGILPSAVSQAGAIAIFLAAIQRAKREVAKEDEAMNYAAACAAEPHITDAILKLKRVRDYKSGQLLGYAPINCRAYESYCDHHSIAVYAGEWIWSGELQGLRITADHSVYFE